MGSSSSGVGDLGRSTGSTEENVRSSIGLGGSEGGNPLLGDGGKG